MLSLGVLVSGNGSNLQALLDACKSGELPGAVRVVISNRADAYALARAEQAGVKSYVIDHRQYTTRAMFDTAMLSVLQQHGVEWLVLAGFMRLLTPEFLAAFAGKVINIHPSLLPAFPGVNAMRQALQYGVKITGCTVHYVDAGLDSGPIIDQTPVRILPEDDETSLAERMHRAEHALLVSALKKIASGETGPMPQRGVKGQV